MNTMHNWFELKAIRHLNYELQKTTKENQVTRKFIIQKAILLFSDTFQAHENKLVDYQVMLGP